MILLGVEGERVEALVGALSVSVPGRRHPHLTAFGVVPGLSEGTVGVVEIPLADGHVVSVASGEYGSSVV